MSLVERLTWLKNRMALRLNDVERDELDDIIGELRDLERQDDNTASSTRLLEAHEEPALVGMPAHCLPAADSPRPARATHPWRTYPRGSTR